VIFIVSEIGVNWNGNLILAEEMIKKSKEAGANAVKFQCFNAEIVKNNPHQKELLKSSITTSNIDAINNISKKIGIEWFCTPMYSDAVSLLDPYVDRYKIRTADSVPIIQNEKSPLFESVLETGKEIMISSQKSPDNCIQYGNKKISWLYVVQKYPCNFSDLDFSKIKKFDGYSNHCPYIIAPLTAAILGSKIIEIHITSDKTKSFFDNNVSFDYNELFNLVNLIRQTEKIKK